MIAGFFPRGTRRGAYDQNNLSVYSKLGVTMKGACWFTRRCLSSSRRRLASTATCSSLVLHKTKGKSGQNQTEMLTNTGTTNTLRKILKNQKARCCKEEVVSEKFQLGEPIQRFPTCSSSSQALQRFYCLSHKLGDGSGHIVLPYVELEVADCFLLFNRGFPEGVPNGFTLVPVRDISST
ncbi:LOW QUALITY PROTEIN: hypothetical protein Cgig2_033748 [Carnegiea gigantea]|uniref:Uncharacterized protein n=1 Tax=Carnegiea gigantea TaxID=171969 RepID=A0A9Q1K114_9CARY|nr:LOW QUALITY PROTEIN: hypothetical protein Cgig2_033748 [Carnegiea gigantea]